MIIKLFQTLFLVSMAFVTQGKLKLACIENWNFIMLLFWLMTIIQLLVSVKVDGRRFKRIIFGRITLDRGSFSAINYYVWIRNLHHCGYVYGHGFYVHRNTHPCPPLPEFLKCGGVLLTPKVIQTACHCLANFVHREKSLFDEAKEQKPWENMYLIYPGFSDVTTMSTGMVSSRYYVHRKCSKVDWEAAVGPQGKALFQAVLHNYGLITMKGSVEDHPPLSNRFTYAPIYTQSSISSLWSQVLSKEYTCLFFGFGNFNRTRNGGKRILDNEQSTYLRIGWRVMTNFYDCYDLTYPPSLRASFKFDYAANATWTCAVYNVNNRRDIFLGQGGDSGGPVTCNGQYFGIMGEPTNIASYIPVTLVSPIAYTLYENSITFRIKFIKFIEKIHNTDVPTLPTGDPINPRPRRYLAKSTSPQIMLMLQSYRALSMLFIMNIYIR